MELKKTADMYLELMIKTLTNEVYGDTEYAPIVSNRFISKLMNCTQSMLGFRLVRKQGFDLEKRKKGLDWPPYAHTMVGRKRLENIQFCAKSVLGNNVPGDFIETGVWRGGSTIFMRAIIEAYDLHDRSVWVADSFEGLPAPNEELYPVDKGDIHYTIDELKVTLESVQDNFRKYDLLDDQVKFLKGWFKDTLPKAPIEKLAIARLDGDMYESTMDAISSLYPKLSSGGFLIVDDYCIKTCEEAITDYRNEHGIQEEMIDIDGTGIFWQKAP
ncbi:MAG: TylF/MycF family methyltransferase [Mariprofundaceae bacterium]|nr:TylF/MycF family methyltransferase [Mariprofundaceae bacterium]